MKRSKQSVTRRAFTATGLGALAALGISDVALAQAQCNIGKPVSPEVEKANVAVVNEFCASFKKNDLKTIESLLADNCSFRISQTRPPITGKKTVVDTLKGFMDRGLEFKVLKTVVLGPVVLNERDDLLGASKDQPARTIRVNAGMFFVQDGKIQEWTDYSLR